MLCSIIRCVPLSAHLVRQSVNTMFSQLKQDPGLHSASHLILVVRVVPFLLLQTLQLLHNGLCMHHNRCSSAHTKQGTFLVAFTGRRQGVKACKEGSPSQTMASFLGDICRWARGLAVCGHKLARLAGSRQTSSTACNH